MLLADRLVASLAGDPHYRAIDPSVHDLAKTVTAATRRLVLTAEAHHLATDARRKPEQLFDFLPLLSKLGGASIWVEWLTPRETRSTEPAKPTPERIGVLIFEETIPSPDGRAFPFLFMQESYSFAIPNDPQYEILTLSPVTAVIDGNEPSQWLNMVEAIDLYVAGKAPALHRSCAAAEPIITTDAENWRAAHPEYDRWMKKHRTAKDEELLQRLYFQSSPLITSLLLSGQIDFRQQATLTREGCHEDAADYGIATMASCLVRAGAFETKVADLDKLNAARRKRGRQPLLSHEVVDTPHTYKRQLSAMRLSPHEIAEHLRRGHFRRLREADGEFGSRVTWVRPTVVATRHEAAHKRA